MISHGLSENLNEQAADLEPGAGPKARRSPVTGGLRLRRGLVGPHLLPAAFAVAVVAQLVPIAALDVFVTVDGALHLGQATAFWSHVLGLSELPGRYATLELLPATNLIPELPLGLLAIGLGPTLAEKLVIGVYAAGFPLAVVWAVRGVVPSRWWLAFPAIPMTFSFPLLFGFLNFVYGLLGFVLVAGHVARHRRRWSGPSVVVLAGLLTATYTAHVLPFALAIVLLGLTSLVDWRLAQGGLGDLLARSAPLVLAAAPGILLAIVLVVGAIAARADAANVVELHPVPRPLLVTLAGLLAMSIGLAAFDIREVVFTGILAAMLASLAVTAAVERRRAQQLREEDAYLAFGAVVVAGYLVLDDGASLASGGGFLRPRLALVPVLALLLWIATTSWRPRAAAGVAVVSIVATLGLWVIRWPWHAEMSDRGAAYAAMVPCLTPEATLAQANLAPVARAPLGRITPFTHETGRLAAATAGWDITNLEFAIPYFPLRNRDETDPYRHLVHPDRPMHGIPPAIDPLGYERRTPGQIDYVIVYGRALADPATLADQHWTTLEGQLAGGYQRVAVSSDGLAEVYERAGSTVALEGAARRTAAGAECNVTPSSSLASRLATRASVATRAEPGAAFSASAGMFGQNVTGP